MVKFVVILISTISLNFLLSFRNVNTTPEITKSIDLAFNEDVLRIEGGQPVYPANTVIVLDTDNTAFKEVSFYINDGEHLLKETETVNLSELHKFESGHYTVVVEATSNEGETKQEIFGFVIE